MTGFVVAVAIAALLLMIGIEIAVLRGRKKRPAKRSSHRHARRQPLLEDRMHDVLDEPQTQYGAIFTSYAVWKNDEETRMELFSGDPWLSLNEFTRALVVRHIWRTLEKLVKGAVVVVVDQPPQEWTAQADKSFDDHGIDPWGQSIAGGPSQFIRDR